MSEETTSTAAAPSPARSSLGDAFRSPIFWLLIVALLATKLIALFTFAHWADADECVVGIMAKHILEQGVHPFYYYGQNYAGGGSIEAHTAAVFYQLFGMSGYTLKLAALVYTLAGAIVLYGLTVRLADKRTAFFALLIYILMPGLIEWGLKTRGGYVTMLPLVSAILWVGDRLIRCDRFDWRASIAFVVLAILGYWNMPHILPLVGWVAVFVLGCRLRRRLGLVLLCGAGCALITGVGAVAWRYRTVSQVLNRLDNALTMSAVETAARRTAGLLTQTLPDFFQPFLNDVIEGHVWPAPVTLLLFLAALVFVAWLVVKNRIVGPVRLTLILILLYVPIYLLCSILAAPNLPFVVPRYLLPLVPALGILAAMAMARIPRWIWISVTGYFFATFIFWNVDLIRHPRLYEKGIFYDPADIRGLLDDLDRQGIRFVRATAVLEWRILFESKERIIAVNLAPRFRYPAYIRRYEQAVLREGAKAACVFEKGGAWSMALLGMMPEEFAQRYLTERNIPYETIDANPYVLFVTRRKSMPTVNMNARVKASLP